MRAFQLGDYVGPQGLLLVELPDPVAGPDDLLIEVEAIGLNFYDELMTRGLYQYRPEPPVVPGSEVAGTVLSAPEGSDFAVGDRAAGFLIAGGFASRVVLSASAAVHVPDGVSSVVAAGATVNYHTAEFSLTARARLKESETVLVLGASGALGAATIQIAARHGATVVAGFRSVPGGKAHIDGTVGSVELSEGYANRVREMVGAVDVVFDPIGGWLTEEGLRTLRPGGRLLVVGFAAGDIPKIRTNRLLLNNIALLGAALGTYLEVDAETMRAQAAFINPGLADGSLRPRISRVVPFTDLPAALAEVGQGRAGGKIVVELD